MTNPTDIDMIDALMARDWDDLAMPASIERLTNILPGAPPSLQLAIQEVVREIFRTAYYRGVMSGLDMAQEMRARAKVSE